MSVVRINVLEVPPERAAELEQRFAARAREIDRVPGFEGFALLKPTDGSNRWFVLTRWASAEAFEGWVNSEAFTRGHAATHAHGPVATGSELLSFDVVLEAWPGR